MAECGTLPNNSFRVHLSADLVFQIEFLLRELVSEIGDLAISQCVLYRDGDLASNLGQELDLILAKGILCQSAESQDTKHAIPADERHEAAGLDTLADNTMVFLRVHRGWVGSVQHHRFSRQECLTRVRALNGDESLLLEESFTFREIERVNPQVLALGMRQHYAHCITVHHATHAR